MAGHEHHYAVTVTWTGNRGSGTSGYRDFDRDHRIAAEGKQEIAGSSDPAFRGDKQRWNPEELLLASVSACHKLWYLHLASEAGVLVLGYVDHAEGTMITDTDGSGRFTEIVLKPQVTIAAGGDVATAEGLHHGAHKKCFIANSLNFPVRCAGWVILHGA